MVIFRKARELNADLEYPRRKPQPKGMALHIIVIPSSDKLNLGNPALEIGGGWGASFRDEICEGEVKIIWGYPGGCGSVGGLGFFLFWRRFFFVCFQMEFSISLGLSEWGWNT